MERIMVTSDSAKLTKNQSLVLSVLAKTKGPMSAYTILDQLRGDGFRAPLQVYRAIEKLLELGLVHRIESLNAFVACQHPSCEEQETVAFMICDTCGTIDEIADNALASQLASISKKEDFSAKTATVELHGNCRNCH